MTLIYSISDGFYPILGFMELNGKKIPNRHSFSILYIEEIAGKLKRAGITQDEMKSGEGYSK